MGVKFTGRIPTVQYGFVEVEADSFQEFVNAYAEAEDQAKLILNPGPQAMQNLANAGMIPAVPQTATNVVPGPPQWAAPDEAQQQAFIPPVPQAQQPPQGWQPSVPQQAPVAGPQCPHGPRTFKSGTNNKGAWTAWFCPAPKGTPGQCEPIWGK